MKAGKPSVTARFVAKTRASLDRPQIATGDAAAELRLYQSLGSTPFLRETKTWRGRMEGRTRFFDRLTIGSLEAGLAQVVIVGAGYDGRPIRFAIPGVTWYEVDHPSTQSDKRARLTAVGADVSAIRFVSIDLIDGDLDASLAAAGHDCSRPSLFLVEGLMGYLPRQSAHRLLRDLRHRAAPLSRLAVAFPIRPAGSTSHQLRHWMRRRLVAAIGEPWVDVYTSPEVDGAFAESGWKVTVLHDTPQRYEGQRGILVVGEPSVTAPAGI